MDDDLTVIGAFLDRERVDPEALVRALSTDDGRQYLVDVVALRDVTVDHPSSDVRPLAPHRRFGAWLAIAATVMLGAGGGYLVGHQRASDARPRTAAVSPTEAVITAPVVPVAPLPTKTITLEPGVNWHEEAGGG